MNATPPPELRVELTERSLRCFTFGLLSLIPVVGLPMAGLALVQKWSIQRRAAGMWNPAERYMRWGAIFATWGAILSSAAAIAIGEWIAYSAHNS